VTVSIITVDDMLSRLADRMNENAASFQSRIRLLRVRSQMVRKSKASVVMQNLDNSHRCQQEEHHFGSLSHALDEYVLPDIAFYGIAGSRSPMEEAHILPLMV